MTFLNTPASRRFAAAFVALTGLAALPAMAQDKSMDALVAAAKAEGKLTLYTSSVEVETQELAKKFEEAYPGIKVEWLRLPSTTLFARFSGEADANVNNVDVLYSASSQLYQLKPQLSSFT